MIQLIAFEGLGLGTPTHIKRGLLDRLVLRDADVCRASFMSDGPKPLNALGTKRIVIGHSMGGASAIAWCNRWANYKFDLLLTLDPRPLHRPYRKPANVLRCVNFYRDAFWMRGYPVEGAENTKVRCGHTQVPALREVLELVEEYL